MSFSVGVQQTISLNFEVIVKQAELQINKMKTNGYPGLVVFIQVFWRCCGIGMELLNLRCMITDEI